jgi:hypothetical protein
LKSNVQEISVDAIPKPNSSELECRRNTSPEVIYPLILGFLQTVTGLPWQVKVKLTDIQDEHADYTVKAEIVMSIPKDKFGSAPDPLIVPES